MHNLPKTVLPRVKSPTQICIGVHAQHLSQAIQAECLEMLTFFLAQASIFKNSYEVPPIILSFGADLPGHTGYCQINTIKF